MNSRRGRGGTCASRAVVGDRAPPPPPAASMRAAAVLLLLCASWTGATAARRGAHTHTHAASASAAPAAFGAAGGQAGAGELLAALAAADSSVEFGGPFASQDPQSFRAERLLPRFAAPSLPVARRAADAASASASASASAGNGSLPSSFDWRDHGAVTTVKDQGTVGTCWVFSAVGNIEGQLALSSGGQLTSLSVEQVVECDDAVNSTAKPQQAACGVFGGYPWLAYEYIQQAGGLRTDEAMPYCIGSGKCLPCVPDAWDAAVCGDKPYCNATEWPPQQRCASPEATEAAARVADWVWVPQDEDEIARQLMQRGPLSVAIDATFLQYYHRGVWDPSIEHLHTCSQNDLDHAVLIVGWGVDKPLVGAEKPYWVVKNSWGASWVRELCLSRLGLRCAALRCRPTEADSDAFMLLRVIRENCRTMKGEDGYFRIARGKNACGIATAVTSAVLDK